jgi:hypothetical protein
VSIYNSIEDFLLAKNKWESTPLRATNEGLFEMIDGKWEKINQYESKPTYQPPPKQNLDGTQIPFGTTPIKLQK